MNNILDIAGLDDETSDIKRELITIDAIGVYRVIYRKNEQCILNVDFNKSVSVQDKLYKKPAGYEESIIMLADIIYLNYKRLIHHIDSKITKSIIDGLKVVITPDNLLEVINKDPATHIMDIGIIDISSTINPPLIKVLTNSDALLSLANVVYNVLIFLEKQAIRYYGEEEDYIDNDDYYMNNE